MLVRQRSFEDLGTPLSETTFCVVDLETTGGSPASCAITEIGAVKVHGGEVLGEFQTLVNPGEPIPTFITVLTGITDAMVCEAPPVESALPMFLEFAGDAVLVAHNAGFDTRFLQTIAGRLDYGRIDNPVVCTVRLARRLVRDEVPNLRLATLAHALRSPTVPNHRALSDARATTDVLHALLELAGRWGVTHLDDLLWFQSAGGHPHARKRILTQDLPRARGVYLFRDQNGALLYVGKASNLRARVRSYFSSDDRRRVGDLVRELATVDHIVARCDLEASVLEARLIRAHRPPYNRAQRGRTAPAFVRLTRERYPRLTIGRTAAAGAVGPMSRADAESLREAIEEATSLRRCSERIGLRTHFTACVLKELGRCAAPCEGRIDPPDYALAVVPAERALAGDPTTVIDALEARIARLVARDRFEEAASARDRIAAVVAATARGRATSALSNAGLLIFEVDGARIEIHAGTLRAVDGREPALPSDDHPDEPRLIAGWLERFPSRVRLLHVSGSYAMPAAGGGQISSWGTRIRRARRDRDT